jgi:hypothetical protein
MASDLVPIQSGEDSPYALLRMEASDAKELLREALGGESLAFKDLDRIKVPGSGGTTWEVPSLEGDVALKELTGVIIHRATRRSYWPYSLEDRPEGDDGRPSCASIDGEIGLGDPGGSCAECPYNEFGSDIKGGPGKACKETRQLFLLTENDLLPLAVTIPPSSLANAKAYFLRLLRNQLSPQDVVTTISLTKEKNAAGIGYARVEFARSGVLSPEAKQRVREYAAAMAPAMEAAAVVKQDEVDR